jgi:hypothetical protein
MQRCQQCRIQLHAREAKTMHDSKTRSHMHMIPTWKQHLASSAVESSRTMVLRCIDCPEMFSTFKKKYEHQVDRECPCGIYFRCRSQFFRHVTVFKCQRLWIRRLPFLKCNNCSQFFKIPSELLAHQKECGRGRDINCQNEEPIIHCIIKRKKKETQRKCTRCGKISPCYCILERIEEGCEKDELVQQKPKERCTSSIRGATEKTLHQSDGRCTFC